MAAIVLKLGDVTFEYMEVPERIRFGVEQLVAVHRLIGGGKVVEPMGGYDLPMRWSGVFRGPDAEARARLVEDMARKGSAVNLTWSEMAYSVVVTLFDGDFEAPHTIPYQIELEPAANLAKPREANEDVGLTTVLGADLKTATETLARVAPGASALDYLSKIGGQLADGFLLPELVLANLRNLQGEVAELAAIPTALVAPVSILGGIEANVPPLDLARRLIQQTVAVEQLPDLFSVADAAARMAKNLEAINASGRNITAIGGNLYRMAVDAYGSIDGWTTIAEANGLTDPVLSGIQEIRIPTVMDDTGGVLA